MTEKQKYLQAIGRLEKSRDDLTKDKREMLIDLVAQRQDIADALQAIDDRDISKARKILADALAYREKNRKQRLTQPTTGASV